LRYEVVIKCISCSSRCKLHTDDDTCLLFELPGETEVSNSHDTISNGKGEVIVDEDSVQIPSTEVTYNIVFVTSEAAPYSKTGGLGDVCGSLPIALAERGHRVMVVSPRYLNGGPADKKFAGAVDLDCRIKVSCSGGVQDVAFFHEYRAGVDWVR